MTADIEWPSKFLPGTTDNFVSNEVIVKDVDISKIWKLLVNPTKWESYYSNCAKITPPNPGPELKKGDHFSFSTFGFPPLSCIVNESIKPEQTTPGRLAWMTDEEQNGIDVYHAWIIENLEGGRVRILTQESQLGDAARQLAEEKPNKMLNGHQDWLDGLVEAARK
ncbi:uncharacterized protein L201_007542 [Kwoniella dendrophila CBS 6074]|uniref:Polyketide cyclase n=1 Tax=Kwoniella dendrophila CBS 6074 TaxID=1295534 RepID=A0AAX4K661_9TREE